MPHGRPTSLDCRARLPVRAVRRVDWSRGLPVAACLLPLATLSRSSAPARASRDERSTGTDLDISISGRSLPSQCSFLPRKRRGRLRRRTTGNPTIGPSSCEWWLNTNNAPRSRGNSDVTKPSGPGMARPARCLSVARPRVVASLPRLPTRRSSRRDRPRQALGRSTESSGCRRGHEGGRRSVCG